MSFLTTRSEYFADPSSPSIRSPKKRHDPPPGVPSSAFHGGREQRSRRHRQEVERTAPVLVISEEVRLHPEDLDKTGIKQVNDTAFTSVLINAVKDLYRRWSDDSLALRHELELLKKGIENKDQRIHELISASDRLKQENSEIRTYLCAPEDSFVVDEHYIPSGA